MMIPRTEKPEYLYLHVPFCRTICSYCDFCHRVYDRDTADAWLQALEKEIHFKDINPKLKTVYIGGGTPTALSLDQLQQLLELLKPYASEVKEYTVEINPETLTDEKASLLSQYGVNRASVGMQTGDTDLLKLIGRHHTEEDVSNAMSLLRKHGIDNISLDLMYSLPTQTMNQLEASIHDAVSMHPQHLSLYSLTIEENTVFGKKGYQHLDDDTEADMYEMICRTLPQYGLEQYEVSNFAETGYQSMHNSAYWNYRDFYGIGCGASGKEGMIRYDHTKDLHAYLDDPLSIIEIPLTKKDAMEEMVMMGMRFRRGMDLHLFKETYGQSFESVFGNRTEKLINQGLVEMDSDHVRCSSRGYEIMNNVLVELIG
jgi:oxygen-independent coproporphyrinogen-3 oxidase